MIYKYNQLSVDNRISYRESIEMCMSSTPNIYLGQFKLLFTELFFLTKCSRPGDLALYVGAAPGYHTTILADLFPEVNFDLWDPRKFETEERPNIKIYNDFFTDVSAKSYVNSSDNILLMVDMRTLKNINIYKKENDLEKFDELVTDDMVMQRNWARIIQPRYSYFKLRFPYEKPRTKYLTGQIYLQPYAPLSTEARLLTNNYDDEIVYDTKLFDEQMAYHNYNNRCQVGTSRKYNKIFKKYNLVNNWDNTLAMSICHYYLTKIKNNRSKEAAGELFMSMAKFHIKKYGKKYDSLFVKSTPG